MSIALNDVNVLSIETDDLNFPAGATFTVHVEAEVGTALHGTGGKYQVTMNLIDTTSPAKLYTKTINGNYGDGNWPAPGLRQFDFPVPAGTTTGRDGDQLEPQASLVSNAAAPYDTSYLAGSRVLITP